MCGNEVGQLQTIPEILVGSSRLTKIFPLSLKSGFSVTLQLILNPTNKVFLNVSTLFIYLWNT
jgi:hypothetical protein